MSDNKSNDLLNLTPLGRGIQAGRLNDQQFAENFSDLHPPLSELQAIEESARCLFCFDAPCTEACPTGIDIPGFIRKIATGNVKGAAVTILSENIMGGTCANVCPVEELCEQVCVKNTSEEKPVVIGRLQRYATDRLFESGGQPFTRAPDSGKHVAVIGAGPAGLSCAHGLAMLGHRVTVYEARPKPGGLNEYGLAAYKMLDERAAKEVEFILAIGGIAIESGKALGEDLTLDRLRHDHDAVFIGLGHNAVHALRMEHEHAEGVFNAVDFIERIRQESLSTLPVGRRVVVIGGGNTAIDIAVQMKKLGAETVTLVYRRGEPAMGATDYEQHLAQSNGVLIKTWAQPARIMVDEDGVTGVEFEYTQYDTEGRLRGTGETFSLPADQVFKAIGQRFDMGSGAINHQAFMQGPALEGLIEPDPTTGRIKVDSHGRTGLPDVWAGGDCVAGRDLTVVAVQDGKIAAHSIHAALTGSDSIKSAI